MIDHSLIPPDNDLPSRKETLDVSKIFLAYLATCGDVLQTATVAQCRVADVLYLAKAELWDAKLNESQIARGPTPEKAKERGREINRMANYIQSVRLRAIIDKTLQWIYENEENVTKFCQEVNKQGNKVYSTKPILDLVKAAESVHAMTYRSLGDTVAKEEGSIGPLGNIKELHLHVIEAMKNSGQLPDEHLKQAEKVNQTDVAVKSVGYLDVNTALEG